MLDPNDMSEEQLAARIAAADIVRIIPLHGSVPDHPEWTEVFTVEDRKTNSILGFVGRIGQSCSYAYENKYLGKKGRGLAKTRNDAAVCLMQANGIG